MEAFSITTARRGSAHATRLRFSARPASGTHPEGLSAARSFYPRFMMAAITAFFFSFETARGSANQDMINPTVPIQSWRTGDFSALASTGVVLHDPFGGAPFPNNQIPATRLNP